MCAGLVLLNTISTHGLLIFKRKAYISKAWFQSNESEQQASVQLQDNEKMTKPRLRCSLGGDGGSATQASTLHKLLTQAHRATQPPSCVYNGLNSKSAFSLFTNMLIYKVVWFPTTDQALENLKIMSIFPFMNLFSSIIWFSFIDTFLSVVIY